MKRFIILAILAISVNFTSYSQPTQRQKMIHMTAVRIAEQIGVKESDKAAFISLYQNYKKESAAVLAIQPATADSEDDAAEAKIMCDFEKSGKILEIRKIYYSKFKDILTPTQIQKMYDAERNYMGKSN